jgi:hypothetical protein
MKPSVKLTLKKATLAPKRTRAKDGKMLFARPEHRPDDNHLLEDEPANEFDCEEWQW